MNETLTRSPAENVGSAPPFFPEPAAYRHLREDCRTFLGLAAASGVGFALCFTDAGGWGLNFPLWSMLWCVLAHRAAKRLGLAGQRRGLFWFGGIGALSLSVFWTANGFVQFVSASGILLLQCFWALSLYADVGNWHFSKAAEALGQLALRSLCRWLEPLRHLAAAESGGRRQWKLVALGLALAVPMVTVAMGLMMSADAVFRSWFDPLSVSESFWTGLRGAFWAFAAMDAFYAVLCAQTAVPVSGAQSEPRRFPAAVAVTFLSVLTALYLLFSAVQIRVLFFRGGGLPEGYTYSEYAREGFFQLLALSALNVAGVIVSQRRFESSRALRVLLCLVSGCTCVMELSSAWRMLMYVDAYGLTFLRLLVLWFLALLSVILAGTVYTVFHPGFRLFRFSLAVCLAGWLLFAFARPDALAARYDLRRFGPTDSTLCAIRYDMAADALQELEPWLETDRAAIERAMDGYLDHGVPARFRDAGLRGFNYSLWQANLTAEAYTDGKE